MINESKSNIEEIDDATGRLPIDYALELQPSHAPSKTFEILLAKNSKSLLHQKADNNNTPLHTALELHIHIEIIEMMLKSCPECCKLENIGTVYCSLSVTAYFIVCICNNVNLLYRQKNSSSLRSMATTTFFNCCFVEYFVRVSSRI